MRANPENTVRKNEAELERQFEGVLEVCYSLSSMMRTMIHSLIETFKDNLKRLRLGDEPDFNKLNYDFSELLETFLTGKDIKPVYNLNNRIKGTMSKIILLIEDLEAIDLESLDTYYMGVLNNLNDQELDDLSIKRSTVTPISPPPSDMKMDYKLLDDSVTSFDNKRFSAGKSGVKFDDLDSFLGRKEEDDVLNSFRSVGFEEPNPDNLLRKIKSLEEYINLYDLETLTTKFSRESTFSETFSEAMDSLFASFENVIRHTNLSIPNQYKLKINSTIETLNDALLSSGRIKKFNYLDDVDLNEIKEEESQMEEESIFIHNVTEPVSSCEKSNNESQLDEKFSTKIEEEIRLQEEKVRASYIQKRIRKISEQIEDLRKQNQELLESNALFQESLEAYLSIHHSFKMIIEGSRMISPLDLKSLNEERNKIEMFAKECELKEKCTPTEIPLEINSSIAKLLSKVDGLVKTLSSTRPHCSSSSKPSPSPQPSKTASKIARNLQRASKTCPSQPAPSEMLSSSLRSTSLLCCGLASLCTQKGQKEPVLGKVKVLAEE